MDNVAHFNFFEVLYLSAGQVDDSAATNLPAAPGQPLPTLKSLTKAAPSPLLQYQLLDIVYTYCFLMRLYNGDYTTDPQVYFYALCVHCISYVAAH